MNKKIYKTDFLFSTPTFLNGMGSVLNIAGNYYTFNDSESDEEADFLALKSDWGVVGEDICESIIKVKKETSTT